MQAEVYQILDAIEAGKYKSALSQAAKALKKNKDSVLIKSMMAYATDRTGSPAVALQMCAELIAAKPAVVDDLALQLISSVLRYNKKYNDIATLYSNASQAMPLNLEYSTQYFMSLVRVNNLKLQQLHALKMQKQWKEYKYFFWAVSAIYLQGVEAPEGSPNIFFPLAEKMLEKAKDENQISTFEELYLYVLVLEAQKKYLGCVKLLSSELASRLCKVEAELQYLVLKYMHLAGQTDSVVDLSRDALRNAPDDWRMHLSLVESLHALLLEEHEDLSNVNVEESSDFIRALDFFLELQQEAKDKVKGPFLGQIELLFKFGLYEKIQPCLVSYFNRFGTTISFFEDVRRYLDTVPVDSRLSLVSALNDHQIEFTNNAKDLIAACRKRINFYKVKFCFSELLTDEEKEEFTRVLIKEYETSLEMGKDLKATERQYGDDCLVITSLLILDRFDVSRETALLYHAILLLETGLQKSTSNFQMKIMLVRLYTALGVSQPVVTHSLSLDVKQVLLDTLTYIYADDFERIAPLDVSSTLVKKALAIYNSNDKETPEMLIQAHKFGTYSKIPEFRKFQLRLSNSIQQAISIRQVALTTVLSLSVPNKFEELSTFLKGLDDQKFFLSDAQISALHDNRDRTMDIKWKAGGKSFFGILAAGEEFPAPRADWIKIYGCVPLAVRTWIHGKSKAADAVDVDKVLQVLESVSDEGGLAVVTVVGLTKYFNKNDSSLLKKVVSSIEAHQANVKTSVSKVACNADLKRIHELFEAISYARIAGTVLAQDSTKNQPEVTEFIKQLGDIDGKFKQHISKLLGALNAQSVEDFQRDRLDSAESVPELVNSQTTRNVLSAALESYKAYLQSLF
ncbi:N-alpha-acetyltransferase 25, NatB auxiliary subunit [Rhizoclosmatium sp. JEL0117]|nr:N-alpha-acetyltransferase 25, NatB auxiliary subunit [Rhizoclosmatium sp. JEL0117]